MVVVITLRFRGGTQGWRVLNKNSAAELPPQPQGCVVKPHLGLSGWRLLIQECGLSVGGECSADPA